MKTQSMSGAQYDAVSKSVVDEMNRAPNACRNDFCPRGDFAGCVLRFAGHDFMDFDTKAKKGTAGGSDGCLDFGDPDNGGLAPCLHLGEDGMNDHGKKFKASLLNAYQKHCKEVSLADFTVISAEAVMKETRRLAMKEPNGCQFPDTDIDFKGSFKFGRPTSATCHKMPRLPEGNLGCEPVERVFIHQMGLNWKEATALMAVHTLGRTHHGFSGFNGWWADAKNQRRFNNHYYRTMAGNGWMMFKPDMGLQKHSQWMRSDHGFDRNGRHREMMLDSDMCLFMDPHPMLKPKMDNWKKRNSGNATAQKADVWAYLKEETCCAWVDRFAADKLKIPRDEHCGSKADDQGTATCFNFNGNKKKCESMAGCNCDNDKCGRCKPTDLQVCCNLGAQEMDKKGHKMIPGGFNRKHGNASPTIDCIKPGDLTSTGRSDVKDYAADEKLWLRDFLRVWNKASTQGFTGLQSLK